MWTPLAGAAVALAELWAGFSAPLPPFDDRWIHFLLAILAAGIAMLGPGAWSVDARRFGRRRL
jgi:putative oxidoreductase